MYLNVHRASSSAAVELPVRIAWLLAQSRQVSHWKLVLNSHRQRPAGRTSLTRGGSEGFSVRVPYRIEQMSRNSRAHVERKKKDSTSEAPGQRRRYTVLSLRSSTIHIFFINIWARGVGRA